MQAKKESDTTWEQTQTRSIMKTNLSITGFNHIIDAIIRKEGGNYGVDKGEGDRSAGPG